MFYSDLAVECTEKCNQKFLRDLQSSSVFKVFIWVKERQRGFGSGCKLFITQALKTVCFCLVGIQKRHLNNLSSPPAVPANLLLFPKEAGCDWSLKHCWVTMPHVTWNCCLFLLPGTVTSCRLQLTWLVLPAPGMPCLALWIGQGDFSLVDLPEVRRNTNIEIKIPLVPTLQSG